MKILIVKLGATGDVVRTTPLLRKLKGEVVWLTASRNRPLLEGLEGLPVRLEVVNWEDRSDLLGRSFDLLIQLEDDAETAAIQKSVSATRLFGAYEGDDGVMSYTSDSRRWFELSLISEFGRRKADELKLRNRSTYQELIFEGLADEKMGAFRVAQVGTRATRVEGELPPDQTYLAGASRGCARASVRCQRRQFANASGVGQQDSMCGFVQLHQSLGDSRVRNSDQAGFSIAG
jgi:heptosyltransferase-2